MREIPNFAYTRYSSSVEWSTNVPLLWVWEKLRLSEDSREITSFIAAGNVYQFKKLTYGLASATEAYKEEWVLFAKSRWKNKNEKHQDFWNLFSENLIQSP